MYVIVWQFQVAAAHEEAFEKAYGPGGDWALLFGRSNDFEGTELLRAVLEDQDPAVSEQTARDYFTIDRWASREAYVAFNERFAREYEELDNRFMELCEVELCLGKFEVVD